MKGMPPAWAASPSTQASPTITMWGASGQRSRTTRRPSGSCFIAVSASIAKGSSTACSMARRSCAWGIAMISTSSSAARARTKASTSVPDHRRSRRGSGKPRSRTKASISRPTALRSSGELTSVWSRSKTQTGGLCATASAAVGGLAVGTAEEVSQELDAAAVQRPVRHDQLDVLRQAGADARRGLLGADDRARPLEHAIQGPGVVGRGEDGGDVHESRGLDRAEEVLAAVRGGADEADGRSLRQLGQPEERLDAGFGEQRYSRRPVRRHDTLDLVDVEEGRDDGAVAFEEARIPRELRLEFVDEHPVHLERQLGFELIAVARQLRVVALDE